jgi:hypothetical protein
MLEIPTRAGAARYQTGRFSVDSISGHRIPVLETMVTTLDQSGTPVRRLRERYAPSLDTATWGVFELPDPGTPEGWRVTQEFWLAEIRVP